jgi:hypothetical protein
MKVNKWIVGLAAAGLVSLAGVAQAEEKQKNFIESAMSSTVLSGYVDVGFNYNIGPDTANQAPPTSFGGYGGLRTANTKADGFNLNVVNLKLEKGLDDSGWAAGYTAELWLGPDANTLGTISTGVGADFAIKQAYVALRTPVGNGIDWKIGVFDTIIGYEVANGPGNPNISRSYGISVEPFQHTGLLGTYKVADFLTVAAGVANVGASSTINQRNPNDSWNKAWMASVAITAPEDTGFLAGSALYAGVVSGFAGTNGTPAGTTINETRNFYIGGTMNTPVAGLKLGFAVDLVEDALGNPFGLYSALGTPNNDIQVYALYASYQATEKLSLHGRAEYANYGNGIASPIGNVSAEIYAITGTVQYDLWQNVLTRIEFRWDHSSDLPSNPFGAQGLFGGNIATGGIPVTQNAYTILAQVVYKF